MNAYLNLVNFYLALEVKNVPNWPIFLILEVSAFLTYIYFLNLAVF